MESFRKYVVGGLCGIALALGVWAYTSYQDAHSRAPGVVSEDDMKQLPPNVRNVKNLGNRWMSFEMEGDDKKTRVYMMRRGWRTDQPDIMIQVQ